MIKVAINGFGRIGRLAFREMITSVDFDVVAINDLGNAEELAYLLKYDTNHRSFYENEISFDDNYLVIANKKRIKVYTEKDPINLPWKDLDIDLVLECSGVFTDVESASKHRSFCQVVRCTASTPGILERIRETFAPFPPTCVKTRVGLLRSP